MRRVTGPGGLVAARDSDYEGFRWFPVMPELDRWMEIYLACAVANGGHPDAGRRLLSWARAGVFDDVEATSSTWCFTTPQDRAWWGGMWDERIVDSAIATQAVETGVASADELASISAAWRRWSQAADGWFSVLHGEIVCRH